MNSDISAYQNDLSIMQTLYIVALLFGFEKVATTIYSLLFETIFSYGVALRSVFVLCGIAIFILGVRLFWSIGNIRRYVQRKISENAQNANVNRVRRRVIIIHFPIALLQAVIFYFVALSYKHFVAMSGPDLVLNNFIYLYLGVLFLNGLWLITLIYPEWSHKPELLWIVNNLTTVGLTVAVMLAGWWLHWPQIAVLTVVVLLFLGNSAVDFLKTAGSYLGER